MYFYIIAFGAAVGVFIILSVLGLQIHIGSKLICHTDKVVLGPTFHRVGGCC